MRTSQYLLATLKETPTDAEMISHRLMLRAGMIRKLSSGIYSWLPLGIRILRKLENIVREEMNASGAHELLMPSIIPAELWKESKRWNQYGKELLRIIDRHEREFCYAPTHEEVITDIARHELHSYKQLPINLYQIQTKFRDEIRPRFGVMRGREFLMKDSYSFHLSEACLQKTYDLMYKTYSKIFTRLGLNFRAVIASTGAMGGSMSQEFQVIAESGEDKIAYSDSSDFAANVEMINNGDVKEGDLSPDGKGKLKLARGIEVGQIFKLGDKYSASMKATVLNEQGEALPMLMGCYGIGISRTMAATIEQNHDKKGIIWPSALAPFQIALIPIAMDKSERVKIASLAIYQKLIDAGFEILFDDRAERPGAMFADMELIGIPHRLVISEKSLDNRTIEYKSRLDSETTQIKNDELIAFLQNIL